MISEFYLNSIDAIVLIESNIGERVHLNRFLKYLKTMFGPEVVKSLIVLATKGEAYH